MNGTAYEATGLEIGRRRRWSLEDKRAVVELSLDPECGVTEVASCFDLIPAQIYAWRRELREMAQAATRENGPVFLPAVIEPAPMPATVWEPEPAARCRLLPDALVSVAMEVHGVPVMVAHGADGALVASVIAALQRAR